MKKGTSFNQENIPSISATTIINFSAVHPTFFKSCDHTSKPSYYYFRKISGEATTAVRSWCWSPDTDNIPKDCWYWVLL